MRRLMPPLAVLLVIVALVAAAPFLSRVEPPPAAPAPARRLLHPENEEQLSPALRPHVRALLSPATAPVPPAQARPGGTFLRIVSKRFAFKDGRLNPDGWLGGRPLVFLTVPETACGKPLLLAFADIGYSADDVLTWENGEEKVALLFRYPNGGGESALPATWANLFALTGRLVAERRITIDPAGKAFSPRGLLLRDGREAALLARFAAADRRRLESTPYCVLKAAGGDDWACRALLERCLGATELYAGTGQTRTSFGPHRGRSPGYPEFLGPNWKLGELPELAVVGLGAVRVVE